MQDEIVYLELNNWFPGEHYPDEEPFLSWIDPEPKNDEEDWPLPVFSDEGWVRDHKLVVVESTVDMSINYCITAPKSWFEKMCPRIFTEEFNKFIRHPDENGDVYGRFKFKEYKEENIGITHVVFKKNENNEWEQVEVEKR